VDGFPCFRKADRAPSLNRSIAGRGPLGKIADMPDTLGYARVSTDDQDLAGQVLRLKAAGAARTYEDVISGRTFDRPGLKALLDYARADDTLCVVRLDRLGRSLRELLEVVETLKARQIALVSLEEKIDTTSAAGELVFHVFGAIAQFERRLIAERTRDGGAAPWPTKARSGEAARRSHNDPQWHVPHQGGPSRRPRPINPLPRARAHTRRTARSGLAGIMEQRTSEPRIAQIPRDSLHD
jgi:DNA invertase Pin-like site-specific DNA recombinase